MGSGDSPPFGAALKRHRLAAGLTHEALAERAGLSARAISDLERGVARAPRPASLRLLAEALGLAPEARAALAVAARPPPPALAGPAARHNLPLQLTSFVGREREARAVRELLLRPDVRLLTLTGTGGAGKTRLALQAAADLVEAFADGACFVSLAPVTEPGLVPSAICRALDVQQATDRTPLEALTHHLRDKHLLLLLDNFEQVLDAAPAVAAVLAACPRLKALVTSRAALHLSGEQQWPVPPLALPDAQHRPDPPTLSQYDAVALFIQRARAVRPDFRVTDENGPAVAAICARLDGLPLAIELAAARSTVLPPQALLARLGNRLATLTGGARDLPERQQTLRRTIDWSHDLLDAEERVLFRRLAVFAGGCTPEAAEAVCAAGDDLAGPPPGAVLDGLAALVDQSLVQREAGGDALGREPRLVLLETVREYAQERLAAAGEAAALERRHAAHYLALAEAAEPEVKRADQAAWLARLEREHDNLRRALAWAASEGQRGGAPVAVAWGLRLAVALARFWEFRGHGREGRAWLTRLLALPGAAAHPALRGRALARAGYLAQGEGDYAVARAQLAEGLAAARAGGDRAGAAFALFGLGQLAQWQGDPAAARPLLEESLALARALGDGWAVARALANLGELALDEGDLPGARARLEEGAAVARAAGELRILSTLVVDLGSLALREGDAARATGRYEEALAAKRALGDRYGAAGALRLLGRVAADRGDYATAGRCAADALRISVDLGNTAGVIAALGGLARVAARLGAPERALRLGGAASRLLDAGEVRHGSYPWRLLERWLAPARRASDTATQRAAWAQGRAMSLEEATAEARAVAELAGQPPAAPVPAADQGGAAAPDVSLRRRVAGGLTERQSEVLRLVAEGRTDREIAAALVLSEKTVGRHLDNIFAKLGVSSRAAAATAAVRLGLA
jgi:non-specific serine/threonine protein kinase